jgi:P-type E1-E2 ATPase
MVTITNMKSAFNSSQKYLPASLTLIALFLAYVLHLTHHTTATNGVLILLEIGGLTWITWIAVEDWLRGRRGVNVLTPAVMVTAFILHQYWVGVAVALITVAFKSLGGYAEHRAIHDIEKLNVHLPAEARMLRGRKEVTVATSDIRPGDKIVVQPGEIVPVDGRVVTGTATFVEPPLISQSKTQFKTPGDSILGGSKNKDGMITVLALRTSAGSLTEQISATIKAALRTPLPFVRALEKYLIPFTIITFGIAATAWILSGQDIRFLEVLVVATPLPLMSTMPMADVYAMSLAAKQRIIIKSGSAFERLVAAKTITFDKDGILTRGEPSVEHVQLLTSLGRSELLRLVGSLSKQSNNPSYQAIVRQAAEAQIRTVTAKHVLALPDGGLEGKIGTKHVTVASPATLLASQIKLPKSIVTSKLPSLVVVVNGKVSAFITFSDDVRPEAKSAIRQLRGNGMQHITLFTGDNQAVAKVIARSFGIKELFAGSTAADIITTLEKTEERPVAYVGVKSNDEAIFPASDLGIMVGVRGSTLFSAHADIVTLADGLGDVAQAHTLAKHTTRIAVQTILAATIANFGLMIAFGVGNVAPLYGVAAQTVIDVSILVNVQRTLKLQK